MTKVIYTRKENRFPLIKSGKDITKPTVLLRLLVFFLKLLFEIGYLCEVELQANFKSRTCGFAPPITSSHVLVQSDSSPTYGLQEEKLFHKNKENENATQPSTIFMVMQKKEVHESLIIITVLSFDDLMNDEVHVALEMTELYFASRNSNRWRKTILFSLLNTIAIIPRIMIFTNEAHNKHQTRRSDLSI
ncbi:hypothetical protein CEXT_2361 [Caerostris extrusa]|uniref:Transmembrane protein n=1 Tax=Caerostris extrusa TaxID=172846 RepID=A0AAV4XYU7_CAEEX|nr:hypothetical protein CEXT_2361 [Caerostris extrusa]